MTGLTGPYLATRGPAPSWPQMAWSSRGFAVSPSVTHAAVPGQDVALCGARTMFHGRPWPQRGDEWPAERTRCPTCAQAVYSHQRA